MFCCCTDGVCGVVTVLVGKEWCSLGEHVLLRAGIGCRSPVYCTGRLDRATQRSHWTSICVELERSGAGNRCTTVAVRCDRRTVLAALNCLQTLHNDPTSSAAAVYSVKVKIVQITIKRTLNKTYHAHYERLR